ncbi:hypothetical protein ACKWTF_008430 [Chironomus riparius]
MIIVFSYIILLKYGPSFMNDRAAYNVKFPMLIYNIFQVTANCIGASYCFYYCFIRTKYDIMCEPYIRGVDEISIAKRNLGYIYFMSKFWDLIDTVFIILKKNHRQLSLLHCYHHLMMATGGYFIMKWFSGGPFVILGFLNSSVHAIMYFYYLLSTFRSDVRTSIKWKKHITQLQMLQFIIVIISFLIPIFSKDCEFSKAMSLFMASQTSLILYLFARFYVKAYLSSNKSTKSS